MDKKLLSILCCPVTHRDLVVATTSQLKNLNKAISAGEVSNREGTVLNEPLAEALVTSDGKLIYPVADGIPVLLEGESISAEEFAGP